MVGAHKELKNEQINIITLNKKEDVMLNNVLFFIALSLMLNGKAFYSNCLFNDTRVTTL